MKAKKFIVLLIFTLLLLLLSSCEREGSDISIKEGGLPSVDYSEGVVAAVVNLDTKKIHTDVNCRYAEMIKNNSLLINTSGHKVGELNGLTIMQIGDFSFGKPSKITVNTYSGRNGIINIEREVELSGSSHSKGVLILSGYLGEMFAQDIPLCLTASICFEQLYNGVDGDSASSTELYGLLSSLSGVQINQAIAVTGSVNQKGEIQPIAGAAGQAQQDR